MFKGNQDRVAARLQQERQAALSRRADTLLTAALRWMTVLEQYYDIRRAKHIALNPTACRDYDHSRAVRLEPDGARITHITCVAPRDRIPDDYRKGIIAKLQQRGYRIENIVLHDRCGCATFEVHPRCLAGR